MVINGIIGRRDSHTLDFMVLNVLTASTPSNGNYVTTYPWSGNVGNSTQVWATYGFVDSVGYSGTYIYPIGNPSVGLNYSRTGGLNPYVTVATVVGNYSADIAVEYNPFNDKFEIEGHQAQNYNKWILEDNLIGTAAAQSGKYCVWARYSSTLFHHIVA